MKRIIGIMLSSVLLLLTGCIFINPTTIDFGSDETTKTFTLTVIGDVGWSINYSESWLTAEPDSGQGTDTVTVTVDRTGLDDDSYGKKVLFLSQKHITTDVNIIIIIV